MGKILGSWSGMRKYLEEDMICDSLKGRIRYNCTSFPNMDGCGLFEIFVDEKSFKRFSMETVASSLSRNNKPVNRQEFWDSMWKEILDKPLKDRTEFDDTEFSEALEIYRNSDIQDSIYSENPIVRMFAVLDRRIGKRTLSILKSKSYLQPDWLLSFYNLRFEAEGI